MSQKEVDAPEVTTVVKDPDSPTGYSVTFRYKDPDATRVRLSGQWMFSDKPHSSLATSLNATPKEWKNGYFVHRQGKWPTVDMTLDQETGAWSHTIPLPNGTWVYTFYVGGVENAEPKDHTDAEQVWDPTHPPLLYDYQAADMLPNERRSDVYVPYDAGGKALAGLLSGETELLTTGFGEAIGPHRDGQIRIIAVSSDKAIEGIPSLKEQGADVEFANWRGFFAAPGISKEQSQAYQDLLEKMMATKGWEELRAKNGWQNLYLPGDQFVSFLTEEEKEIGDLMRELGFLK